MTPRTRATLGWVARLAAAAALVALLAAGGRLPAGPTAAVLARPGAALALVALQLLLLALGALRWWLLLRAVDGRAHGLPRLLALTWMGQFFGCVAPGSLAADATRFAYLRAGDRGGGGSALASLLVDRACGVLGSCLLAAALGWPLLARLRPAPALRWGLAGALALGVLAAAAARTARGRALAARLGAAARAARRAARLARRAVPAALAIAVLAHGLKVLSLVVAVRAAAPHARAGAVVGPGAVGFLAEAVPLTPAGAGTSHLAFEWLLSLRGVGGGAALFHAVFLARLAVSLGGGVVWVAWGGRAVGRSRTADAPPREVAGAAGG